MNNEKKILLILFIIFLLTSSVVLFLRSKQTSPPAVGAPSQSAPRVSPASQASINISLKERRNVLKKGEPVALEVSANSNNMPISGYDINIIYPASPFKFKSFTNLNKQFTTATSNLAGQSPSEKKVAITGMTPLSGKAQVLKDTVLGVVTFEPGVTDMLAGSWGFRLEFVPGSKKDSNLITTESKDILGSVGNEVAITYGKQLVLTKDKIVSTTDSAPLYLKLVSVSVPDSNCRDCATSAQIEVSRNEQFTESNTVNFSSGGFAGRANLSQTVFSWLIEVESIQNNQVILLLAVPSG